MEKNNGLEGGLYWKIKCLGKQIY